MQNSSQYSEDLVLHPVIDAQEAKCPTCFNKVLGIIHPIDVRAAALLEVAEVVLVTWNASVTLENEIALGFCHIITLPFLVKKITYLFLCFHQIYHMFTICYFASIFLSVYTVNLVTKICTLYQMILKAVILSQVM